MKVVAGLGNPGAEYDETRHNVGWWVVDRLAYDWGFGSFQREGALLATAGSLAQDAVILVKPLTSMNRSGVALATLRAERGFDPTSDLLVVVDDSALEVGRVRLRPSGSPGGHNGLRSVSRAVGTDGFARLRVGVGIPPPGEDMVQWVLSPMLPEDEDIIIGLMPELTRGVEVWLAEGAEAAMNQLNR